MNLVESTKLDGTIAVCVYSYENNFVMTALIEPLKKIIHLFPLKTIKLISFFPALILFYVIKSFYVPINKIAKTFADKLPLNEQMVLWARNSFKMILF